MRIFLVIALICAAIGLFCVVATATVGIGALGWLIASLVAYYLNDLTNEYRIGPPVG